MGLQACIEKRKKRCVDAQVSMREEIFKCRQTHLSKKNHFIIISEEKERGGLLRGLEAVQ